MTNYHRIYIPGATWFFTVNLAERRDNRLLIEHIDSLRSAFSYVKRRKPFTMEAVVIMPDHLHTIWRLPPDDADYSSRWSLVKSHFSRAIPNKERISESRKSRRERGIWQRRYWPHLLTSQQDFNNHCDYIHWNPVKHGYAAKVATRMMRFVPQHILSMGAHLMGFLLKGQRHDLPLDTRWRPQRLPQSP